MQVPKRKCLAEDRVTIRIWTSVFNKTLRGEDVGHISIETSDSYMSLWPKGRPSGIAQAFFQKRPPHYMSSYKDDLEAEGRSPELIICLYSLNGEEIEEEFTRIKDKIDGWALFGGNALIDRNGAESCVTLAYKLLKKGGLYELISSGNSSRFASVISPDNLSDAIVKAKKEELIIYPETSDYRFEEETVVEVLESYNSKCLVM
jgi:hypothetical protein